MKEPEEIHDDMYVKRTALEQIDVIRDAQNEAYNQALKDVQDAVPYRNEHFNKLLLKLKRV